MNDILGQNQPQPPSPQEQFAALPIELQQAAMNPPEPPSALSLQPLQQLDEGTKKAILPVVTSHLTRMRNFRRQFDQRRLQFYRQYLSVRDQQMYPDNVSKRSNTTVPYPLSNVETVVSRVLDAFFSFQPFFDCKGRVMQDDGAADKMQMVLEAKLKHAGLVPALEVLTRNIAIYGHAALKVDWDWGFDHVVSAQEILARDPMGNPIMNPMTGMPIVLGYQPVEQNVPRNRPRFTPIDVFDLLVDPDGNYIAHMVEKTLGQLLREAQTNPNLYYPDAIKEISDRITQGQPVDPNSVIIRIAEFWDEVQNTVTLLTYNEDKDAITLKDQRFANRVGAAYTAYRRKVFDGSNVILYHGENPFMHKRAPILHTSYIKLPNEIFGVGAIECISNLNESLNRFINMIADNWNLGINKRYAYDLNADIDMQALNNANVPGGKVGVNGDPSKVLMPLPAHTPIPEDYTILGTYKDMIEMSSGISDFYGKGMGSPSGNRTATGINSIINESNFRFKMFIRNLEVDVLQPALQMCATMMQQYITTPEEVLITKDQPGLPKYYQVQPSELLGNFDFDLVAANYAENKVIRQRNILAFANMASQSPFLDQYNALIEFGKLFEIRNISRMLKTPQQVAMEQQAQLQQQMKMMLFESMLNTESKARLSQAKPSPGGKDAKTGRPRSPMMPEGKLPGAGLGNEIREFAQSHGVTGFGLEGAGGGAGG